MVSTGWKSELLGSIATLQRGFDLPFRLRKPGAVPIVTSSGIEERHCEAKVKGPGVVTGRYGTIGEVFFVREDFWPLNTTLYVRDFHGNDPLFISYLLRTIDFHTHSGKSGVPGVNRNDLHEIVVHLPPTRAEQETIAEALSDADTLIESLVQLLAKKHQIKQGTLQELIRPNEMWKSTSLGSVADPNLPWSFTGGPFGSNLKTSDYTAEGVRIIQLQNIGDGEFKGEYEVYTSREKATELLSCKIYPGDVILSKMGDPVARACIVPPHRDCYLMCSDGIRLAVDKRRFNSYFILTMINAPDFRAKAANAGTGSTRKRIGINVLRSLELLLPPLPQQSSIALILSDMDAEIVALEAKLTKARQIKQGMMQELLTGRIRLV